MGTISEKIGIVDLFAGICGGVQGFEEHGGFETVALVDNNRDAYETYIGNFPNAPYLCENIEDVAAEQINSLLKKKNIYGIIGCPPCQGFSAAGKRNARDPRNNLVTHYFRLVKEIKPHFVVLENVPEIFLNKNFVKLVSRLKSDEGYKIWQGVLNAALFGVPQSRQRAIIIAIRADVCLQPSAPHPTHGGTKKIYDYISQKMVPVSSAEGLKALGVYPQTANIMLKKRASVKWLEEGLDKLSDLPAVITVKDAIGDLPRPSKNGEESTINAHVAREHSKSFLDKLSNIPEGGRLDLNGKDYYSQAYGRLHRNGLARTITCSFQNPGSGRYLHYKQLRSITAREAARLQGISDSFKFIKSHSVNSTLIGNAFPKPLARALAAHIYSYFNQST